MNSPIPDLPAVSTAGDLLRGVSIPLRAFTLILRTPKLLMLSLACAAVTGLTLIGVAWGASGLAQRAADALISADSGWQHAASIGLSIVFFIMLFVVGALTVPNLLLAPLQDPLSEATEERCGDFTSPPFSLSAITKGIIESLSHTLMRLSLMLLGLAVLFPLHFIPVAGSVSWVALSSIWSMFWIAAEHLSNPMARHLRPFKQVIAALRGRLPLALGFGAALYVLLWVPVLNFFLMPVAVVAGTLLFRGMLKSGALPEAARQ
ncbi:MAG: EI24 domain-containing protein [Archangium sp.]|nr:EI24 domain-containing protein [Archangium sp.]